MYNTGYLTISLQKTYMIRATAHLHGPRKREISSDVHDMSETQDQPHQNCPSWGYSSLGAVLSKHAQSPRSLLITA